MVLVFAFVCPSGSYLRTIAKPVNCGLDRCSQINPPARLFCRLQRLVRERTHPLRPKQPLVRQVPVRRSRAK